MDAGGEEQALGHKGVEGGRREKQVRKRETGGGEKLGGEGEKRGGEKSGGGREAGGREMGRWGEKQLGERSSWEREAGGRGEVSAEHRMRSKVVAAAGCQPASHLAASTLLWKGTWSECPQPLPPRPLISKQSCAT